MVEYFLANKALLIGSAFLFGLLVGSFLNVVILRLPAWLEWRWKRDCREMLELETVEGDMADLSFFADESFDLIVHPCSNLFVPAVRLVWEECYRVLRLGGLLLAGFCNPINYIFDQQLADAGTLQVRYPLPYSDVGSLSPTELQRYLDDEQPLEYSHTVEDQLGGQLDAGFVLTGFYEDRWADHILDHYMPTFFATCARKEPKTP